MSLNTTTPMGTESPNPPTTTATYTISKQPYGECDTCQQRRWLDCDILTNPELCTCCRFFGGECSAAPNSMNDALYDMASHKKAGGILRVPKERTQEMMKKKKADHTLPRGWKPDPSISLEHPPSLPSEVLERPLEVLTPAQPKDQRPNKMKRKADNMAYAAEARAQRQQQPRPQSGLPALRSMSNGLDLSTLPPGSTITTIRIGAGGGMQQASRAQVPGGVAPGGGFAQKSVLGNYPTPTSLPPRPPPPILGRRARDDSPGGDINDRPTQRQRTHGPDHEAAVAKSAGTRSKVPASDQSPHAAEPDDDEGGVRLPRSANGS
ncbi:hypothetical protein PRZ48_009917 [Zasmidium cellare]|uniref:Uncharacterized protein n=1 Tax=Zasmidium cellare TaxID=395010 RepID=A0ABR0EEA7_ZASCE|nr:hypothetical protein PRZ48_009917 [Zasmidium cellare]